MAEGSGTRTDRLFRVDVERDLNGTAVVVVEGDVDLHSGPALRDRLSQLSEEGTRRVIVDLSDATFLDSMALGVLLGAKRDLAEAGGALELVVTREDIRRIFEITMLEKVLVLHGSREDAIRAGAAG
jgi:anti-sigma B factor antagonist